MTGYRIYDSEGGNFVRTLKIFSKITVNLEYWGETSG